MLGNDPEGKAASIYINIILSCPMAYRNRVRHTFTYLAFARAQVLIDLSVKQYFLLEAKSESMTIFWWVNVQVMSLQSKLLSIAKLKQKLQSTAHDDLLSGKAQRKAFSRRSVGSWLVCSQASAAALVTIVDMTSPAEQMLRGHLS